MHFLIFIHTEKNQLLRTWLMTKINEYTKQRKVQINAMHWIANKVMYPHTEMLRSIKGQMFTHTSFIVENTKQAYLIVVARPASNMPVLFILILHRTACTFDNQTQLKERKESQF